MKPIRNNLIKTIISMSLCLVLFLSLVSCGVVRIPKGEGGALRSDFSPTKVNTVASPEDLKIISEIFAGKMLYSDQPSCGFDECVSIKIDGQTFCFANDSCGIVYLLEKDQYFKLSDEERDIVHEILTSYGFCFPCI